MFTPLTDKFASEARVLCRKDSKRTLTERQIHYVVRLLFTPEAAAVINQRGEEALQKFKKLESENPSKF